MKILKFTASWCAPCKMLTGVMMGIQDQIPYPIEEYDIEVHSDTAVKYNVRTIPTTIILDGDTEVKRKVGPMSTPELKLFLGINS